MLRWIRRRPRSSRRPSPRRGRLYLEPLETRALLAAGSFLNPLALLSSPPRASIALVAAQSHTAVAVGVAKADIAI
ncbi:MAG TPA: hypothetical protein VEL76_39765, partial [Gemmataceae bacterium]|nr:hypothetical protein [Gemmataceae bacterium]